MEANKKLQAVFSCNKKYDGKFFYAVKTTKIFCRPSCPSKKPNVGNILYFENARQALQAGFRPCKRCRPDLLAFDPAGELVQAAKDLIQLHYAERDVLSGRLNNLGVSYNHLCGIFKEETGMTPLDYLGMARMQFIKHSLETTRTPIVEIAMSAGYHGISGFYKLFKKHTGTTPRQYRLSMAQEFEAQKNRRV